MIFNLLTYSVVWLLIELFYFKLAERFNIIDKPNARSSHAFNTIRGGGIIFSLAALFSWPYTDAKAYILAAAILVMSLVSFIDDVKNLKSGLRLTLQIAAMLCVCYFYSPVIPLIYLPIVVVMLVGIINAYNFMDGINSITALYSFVTICTLFWVHKMIVPMLSDDFFIAIIAAIMVFGFFNIRKKARAFAGDVGSVSMAMIVCILILDLVVQTKNMIWICFLGIYGIDTTATIVCRILRGESILQAHRSHFYQYLANERKWSHLSVSFLYSSCQLVLNLSVIIGYFYRLFFLPLVFLFGFLLIYIIFRLRLEGRRRLFNMYNRKY